jgi:hypothetical protein
VGKYELLESISSGISSRDLEKLYVRKKEIFFSTKSPECHCFASGFILENRKLILIIASVGCHQKVMPYSVADIQQ